MKENEDHTIALEAILDTLPQLYDAKNGVVKKQFQLGSASIECFGFRDLSPTLADYVAECIDLCQQLEVKSSLRMPRVMRYEQIQQLCATLWLEKQTEIKTWDVIFDYFYRIQDRTIENVSIAKSFIVSAGEGPKPVKGKKLDFGDKSTYKLLDWLSNSPFTYFKVTPQLDFISYESIRPSAIKDFSPDYVPDFLWPMASQVPESSAGNKAVLVEGNQRGDLLISSRTNVIASRIKGRWSVYDLNTLEHSIPNCLRQAEWTCSQKELGHLARVLFRILFDIGFRRHGSLIIVDKDLTSARKYLSSAVFADDESELAEIIPTQSFAQSKPEVTAIRKFIELSSIDGAVVLSIDGRINAYAAMVVPHADIHDLSGARTIAAKSAARNGAISFKVSSDGEVNAYFTTPAYTGTTVHDLRF